MYNWDCENCPLFGVAGCLLFRGCLSSEVSGRTVGTFRIVYYIVGICCWRVSVKWGSTVALSLLYCKSNIFKIIFYQPAKQLVDSTHISVYFNCLSPQLLILPHWLPHLCMTHLEVSWRLRAKLQRGWVVKFSTVCAPFSLTFCNFGSEKVTGCYCCPDADAERSIAIMFLWCLTKTYMTDLVLLSDLCTQISDC